MILCIQRMQGFISHTNVLQEAHGDLFFFFFFFFVGVVGGCRGRRRGGCRSVGGIGPGQLHVEGWVIAGYRRSDVVGLHCPVVLRDENVIDAAGHRAFAGDLEAIGQEVSNAVVSVVAVHVAVRVGGDDRGQVLHTQLLAQSQDHFGRMLVSLTSIRARALIVQAPVRAEEHKGLALPLQLGIAHEALGVAVRPFLSKVLVAAEAPEGNHPRLVEDAIERFSRPCLLHTVA
mmetsp:Transcript_107712/g.270203  ORF Transcript_107712/g.270203 Transcript_107712/m.270203 type:complete len:231 (-) Transcript_107712:444-1136(-)